MLEMLQENDSRCLGLFELDTCLSDPHFAAGHTPDSSPKHGLRAGAELSQQAQAH